jgi:large conductance mechanosensitive channel
MKAFMKEFKEFISKGNVMDLAVGVIIGGAFQAIVGSLVNDIIMPLLGIITGGLDFSHLAITVGEAQILYGSFISAIINFLLMALVLFLVIKALNKAKSLTAKPEEPKAPTTKKCPYCQSDIPLAATRCPHCTSELK